MNTRIFPIGVLVIAVLSVAPAFGAVRPEADAGPCARGASSAKRDTTSHVTESRPTGCAIEGSGNCQMCNTDLEDGDHFVLLSDLTVPPGGAVHADDFIPDSSLIDTICVWGTYLDASNAGLDNHSCSGEVEDNFRVRIYTDNAGLPGDLVAERWVEDPPKSSVPDCPSWNYVYLENDPLEVFTLSFPTITLAAPGVTYWLEVANKTDYLAGGWEPSLNTCYWHWMQVVREPTGGNRVNAVGTNDRCAGGDYDKHPCATHDDCDAGDCKAGYGGGYIDGSERWSGTMFCLGYDGAAVNFAPGSVPTGACCDCDDICVDDLTQAQCADLTTGFDRRWMRGEVCASTAACDPEPGDNCQDPPGCIPITDGLYAVDTACTNTDGPTGQGGYEQGKDAWYCFTTSRVGTLVASMCPSSNFWGGYDSYMEIYHDWDNPTVCPCPGDSHNYLVACSDEGCNGIFDGGAGTFGPTIVFSGECWLIRVGGWGQTVEQVESGPGFLDVYNECVDCEPVTVPPEPERLNIPPNYPISTKNRFLSIVGANPGWSTATRVTAVELPSSHDIWEGRQWFVGEPHQVCENPGQGSNVDPRENPPGGCGQADSDDEEQNWFWAAPLVCDMWQAHHMDWTTLSDYCNAPGDAHNAEPCWSDEDCGTGTCGVDGVIHVYHEAIIPSHLATATGPIDEPAIYDIQSIASIFSLGIEGNYSEPLTLTQAGWGDVVTSVADCPNGPPDSRVDVISDVVALLNKFKSDTCAPKKTRANLFPHEVSFKINITDLVQCLGAFVGEDYPYKPGECVDSVCSGGPDHGTPCTIDDDCSSSPCGLDQ